MYEDNKSKWKFLLRKKWFLLQYSKNIFLNICDEFEIVKYAFWMPITKWKPFGYTCAWFLCYIYSEQETQYTGMKPNNWNQYTGMLAA